LSGGEPGHADAESRAGLVTVVVPTRDRWPLLARALASFLFLCVFVLYLVVCDVGSSDETPDRLAGADGERVRVLRNETPTGVARARNRGIEAARGEWVAFLDDDDFWAPDKLRMQLAACAAAGAGFSYTGLVTVDPELGRRRVSSPHPASGLDREILGMNVVGPPSGVIVRRRLLAQVGGFDPSFSILADWDMWIRLAATAPAAACDAPLTGYLSHDENMHLDAAAAVEELRRLRAKHSKLADTVGVTIGDGRWWRWIAATYRRSGHRFKATAAFLWSAVELRRAEPLARAAGTLVGPRLVGIGRHLQGDPVAAGADRIAEAAWVDAFREPSQPLDRALR
jgi:glycosyltransferase involved in cell wall biosynthesis